MRESAQARPQTITQRSSLSAAIVMACTAGSRLFGYVRQALFSYYFGASGAADSLNAVFNIPNNLRKLFAEGALSSAFIPTLSSAIEEDPSGVRPRRLASNLAGFLLIVLIPLVGLSIAFPGLFVETLLRFSDPGKVVVASQGMQWMFNYILLVSLSALVMAVLNSYGRFTVPALSPLLFTLATVLSIVFLNGRFGILSMGIGVLIGGVLQLAVQLPSFRRLGFSLRPDFRLANPDFTRTIQLWLPYLASASIPTITQFFAQLFARGLEDGSVSAIVNSVMFLQIPIGIFTASINTVLFPRMSRQATRADRDGLRESVSYGIESLIVLLVPSTVLLCLFGREIIAAALQRGHFTEPATLMAARALTGYAVGLVCMGVYTFLQRLFYSLKSFSVPLVSAAVVAVIDIALSLVLKETPLRVSGLAYANSIAFTAGVAMLGIVARRRLGGIGFARIAAALGKSLLGSIPMAAFLLAFLSWKPDLWVTGGSIRGVAWIAAAALVSVALTLAVYLVLKVPFLADVIARRRKE
ncbi:MAG TPA: murein biosynthesis integral membrane protein MurJ [Spirochaetia bacterium]|nr:murein biosynthesis integral membrane protein MurJ [Spirochaetia bacterium]